MHIEKPKPNNPSPAPVKEIHQGEYELGKLVIAILNIPNYYWGFETIGKDCEWKVCFLHTLDPTSRLSQQQLVGLFKMTEAQEEIRGSDKEPSL